MAVSVKGDYGITIVRSDGTVESTISCGTQCSFLAGPNWSRDGSKLAITGRRDTLSVLFVVNRDGTNLHEVASAPRLFIALPNHTAYWTEFHEDWSTDGRLVYVRSTPAGNNIETIAADGTGRLTVIATTDSIRTPADVFVTTNPRWGLGDSMISLERSSQVYAMNPDGSNLRALTSVAGGAFQHTWSPDGNSIAFSNSASNQWAIWVLDPVSSSLRQVAVPALSSFCWAPNSAGFSLVSQPSAQENWKSIYTLNRDGSGLQKSVIAVMDMLDQVIGAWSPDGRFLVYMDDRSSAGGPAGAQLYAQSLAERTNTRLGNAQNVIFFSVAAARGCGGSFAYP
jgi:Tol biopolymer transport system component